MCVRFIFCHSIVDFFGILTGNEREFFLSVNWSQDDSKITDKITNDAKSILKIQINGFRFAMITWDISYASNKHMIVSWFHTILCGYFGGEITTQIQKSPKSLWISLEKPIKCVSHLTAYEKRANREAERKHFPISHSIRFYWIVKSHAWMDQSDDVMLKWDLSRNSAATQRDEQTKHRKRQRKFQTALFLSVVALTPTQTHMHTVCCVVADNGKATSDSWTNP